MIVGVGIDIVRVDRIERAMSRWGGRFLARVFTPGERRYCDEHTESAVRYAARFAVKEAVFKALGRGRGDCGGFTSVEVEREKSDRPFVVLSGRAREYAAGMGVVNVHVSLTHDAGVAAAVAVIEA